MRLSLLPLLLASALSASAQTPDASMIQQGSDIPAKWKAPEAGYNYEKRVVEIEADRTLFADKGIATAVVEVATSLAGKPRLV